MEGGRQVYGIQGRGRFIGYGGKGQVYEIQGRSRSIGYGRFMGYRGGVVYRIWGREAGLWDMGEGGRFMGYRGGAGL